jgi:hypothetical protein
MRSGDTVSIGANQVLEGDFYGFGKTIMLSGSAREDVYALGGTVTVNGSIAKDFVAIGADVQVHGEVSDDARVGGLEVVIAEPVRGDLVVIGGTVHVLSTASVGGDMIVLGGDVKVDGPVTGSLVGAGEAVRISASVGGDVRMRIGRTLTFTDTASVGRDVIYTSEQELIRAQGTTIAGTVSRTAPVVVAASHADTFRPIILNVLMMAFSSLVLLFVLRKRTRVITDLVREGYGRLGLVGLGMILALPIVAMVFLMSVVGLMPGFALLLGYSVIFIVGLMFIPLFLGLLVGKFVGITEEHTVLTVVLGVIATILLTFIPVVGPFTLLVLFLMVEGALYTELYRFFKGS